MQAHLKVAAVLFHRDSVDPGGSWLNAVRLLKLAMPRVLLIACHGFSEPIDWPELCDAGAFHTLWLPLKESEVRQSLGFIFEARNRPLLAPPPPEGARTRNSVQHLSMHIAPIESAPDRALVSQLV